MERSVGMWFKYMCCLISLAGFFGFAKPSPNFEALSIAIVMCGFLIGKE